MRGMLDHLGIGSDTLGDAALGDGALDRRRIYLSKKGAAFEPHERSGIDFPTVNVVPLAQDGSPDTAKAKERRRVQQEWRDWWAKMKPKMLPAG